HGAARCPPRSVSDRGGRWRVRTSCALFLHVWPHLDREPRLPGRSRTRRRGRVLPATFSRARRMSPWRRALVALVVVSLDFASGPCLADPVRDTLPFRIIHGRPQFTSGTE